MIDFNNAENIDRAAKDFVSSHDLLTLDFSGYRKCQIGDEDDISKYPAIKELINKDKHGGIWEVFIINSRTRNLLTRKTLFMFILMMISG